MKLRRLLLLTLMCLTMPVSTYAQSSIADSTRLMTERHSRKGFFGWLGRYLSETNKERGKKFDMSLMLGPSYNATTNFSIGGVACGQYSWDRADSTLQLSNVSIFGNLSVTGMAAIGVEGKNFLPHDRWRINYTLAVTHMPTDLWGIGYSWGEQQDNAGSFSRIYTQFKPEFLYRLGHHLYVGPMLNIEYTYAFNIGMRRDGTDPFVDVDGSRLNCRELTVGAGLSINYDTRDVVTNASRGVFVRLQQQALPRCFGNRGTSGCTDLTLSHYFRAWRGCVIAHEFHSMLTYGDMSWTQLAQLGGGYRMRGYYMGQYRDENIAEYQLEFRQHIWSRSGAVVWVGCGNVWGREAFRWHHTLPNYGFGYRWEFKRASNVRIDCGFTKRDWNICFNINEAF